VTAVTDKPTSLTCSLDEIEPLKELAASTTAGIWRIKRAKALLSALEETSPAQLMFQVRVPVKSIIKCVQEFSHLRMAYFDCPSRPPTAREAAVEAMLDFSIVRRAFLLIAGIPSRCVISAAASPPETSALSVEPNPLGGLVAALSFSGAAWRVACRDDYIGWTDAQHR